MDKINEVLTRGVEAVYPSAKLLEQALRSGKKLKLYQGFDPTGTLLHIGHLSGLMKLRQFQRLGHEVIFLIGDGTGQAGDPSGKTRSREKYLSNKELRENAKDYVMQARKIVDFDGENRAKIMFNGDWLNALKLNEILDIAGHFTLQQMEERDIFQNRKKEGIPISLREFLYPLLQGYDSVAMNVDLEIGGSDQTFNMLCGRSLVKDMLHKEKFVLTTPLLTDSQGRKIGKTEGNVIALNSPPNELYGMIMSLGDDVILTALEQITDMSMDEIKKIKEDIAAGQNPMVYKKKLAFILTHALNSEESARIAQERFEHTVQHDDVPEDLQEFRIVPDRKISLIDALFEGKIVQSRGEAKRLILQKAVEKDGQVVQNTNQPALTGTYKVGKRRHLKIVSGNKS